MTAQDKQNIFKEVAEQNAESLKCSIITEIENFCHDQKNVSIFISSDEEQIQQLAINTFERILLKRLLERNNTKQFEIINS